MSGQIKEEMLIVLKKGRKPVYPTGAMTASEKQKRARTRSYIDFTSGSMDAKKISTSNLIAMLPKFFSSESLIDAETRTFYLKRALAELTKRSALLN